MAATVFAESPAVQQHRYCRYLRTCAQALLAPIGHPLYMLMISLTAIVSAGVLISRLENYGSRGRQNTLQYAAESLDNVNLTDEDRVQILHDWSSKTQWDTEEGIYYTFSLFSTIGYGKYAPETSAGRGVSVVFIVLVVPFGVLHVQCISFVYQSLLRQLLLSWRNKIGVRPGLEKLIFPSNDSSIILIPVTVLTLVLHLHLAVAILFLCLMERWTPMQSLYYLITATATIGFGDLHTGPHSLLYVLAVVMFQIHLCAIFMLIINYLNDVLEWILQSCFSPSTVN